MDAVRLNILFEKYAAETIDAIEFRELAVYIDSAADEDLYALLWEQWQITECRPVFHKIRRERMLNNILSVINQAEDQT